MQWGYPYDAPMPFRTVAHVLPKAPVRVNRRMSRGESVKFGRRKFDRRISTGLLPAGRAAAHLPARH
jgi:hypothetical protein